MDVIRCHRPLYIDLVRGTGWKFVFLSFPSPWLPNLCCPGSSASELPLAAISQWWQLVPADFHLEVFGSDQSLKCCLVARWGSEVLGNACGLEPFGSIAWAVCIISGQFSGGVRQLWRGMAGNFDAQLLQLPDPTSDQSTPLLCIFPTRPDLQINSPQVPFLFIPFLLYRPLSSIFMYSFGIFDFKISLSVSSRVALFQRRFIILPAPFLSRHTSSF